MSSAFTEPGSVKKPQNVMNEECMNESCITCPKSQDTQGAIMGGKFIFTHVCSVTSVVSDSLRPHGLYSSAGSSVHGILQAGILTGLGCHALLRGIFPTHGSNPCLLGFLHCRWIFFFFFFFTTEPPGRSKFIFSRLQNLKSLYCSHCLLGVE